MQVNSRDNWRIELATQCRVPLSPEVVERLNKRWEEHMILHAERGTEEYRLKASRQKWEAKLRDNARRGGSGNYVLPEDLRIPEERMPYEDALAINSKLDVTDDDIASEFDMMVRNEIRLDPGRPRPHRRVPAGEDELDDELDVELEDDEEDDEAHLALLRSLPDGAVLDDDHFEVLGMEGGALVLRFRDPRARSESDEEIMDLPEPIDLDSELEIPPAPTRRAQAPPPRFTRAPPPRFAQAPQQIHPEALAFQGYQFDRRRINEEERLRDNPPEAIIGTVNFGGVLHDRVRFIDGTFGAIGPEFVLLQDRTIQILSLSNLSAL
jgi:hypothetical protein